MYPAASDSVAEYSLPDTGVENVAPLKTTAEALPALPGYRLVRELGRGAMGVVYEATDLGLNRTVALKLVTEEHAANPLTQARFGDEAEAVARLRHPNVVEIYRVGEHHGRGFLALEYVRGGSLADRLKAGPLSVAAVVDLVRTVARAVQHAHENRVIHRDLKPGNILLDVGTSDDPPSDTAVTLVRRREVLRPKVSDFGLAKFTDQERRRTRSGMFLGTLGYIAPELIDTPETASPASDVYALGVILFECLTGTLPIQGKSFLDTIQRILDEVPVPPSRFRVELPPALDAICQRALSKKPGERYPTAAAFADDLDRVADGRTRPAPAETLRRVRGGVQKQVSFVVLCVAALAGLHCGLRYSDGRSAARAGEVRIDRGDFAEAEAIAGRGLSRVRGIPGTRGLAADLSRLQAVARRGRATAEFHRAMDRVRFAYEPGKLPDAARAGLLAACDDLWAARADLARGEPLTPERESQVQADLVDLALVSADLRVRDRAAAVARLQEAEELLGPDAVLSLVRESWESGAELPRSPAGLGPDPSAGQLLAVGRMHLGRGNTDAAVAFLRNAAVRDQGAFWPNFHLAQVALAAGKPEEALSAFSECLGAAQDRRAAVYYNRAVAYEALGRLDGAERDLDAALKLEPGLARASFRRGVIRYHAKRWPEAAADLEQALRAGHPAATVWYHQALVRQAAGDTPTALTCATEAARLDPSDARITKLLAELRR